jgi:hypothetical protein
MHPAIKQITVIDSQDTNLPSVIKDEIFEYAGKYGMGQDSYTNFYVEDDAEETYPHLSKILIEKGLLR